MTELPDGRTRRPVEQRGQPVLIEVLDGGDCGLGLAVGDPSAAVTPGVRVTNVRALKQGATASGQSCDLASGYDAGICC